MIHLIDSLHFEATNVYQKEFKLSHLTFRIELLLILLFLFCSACAPTPNSAANSTPQTLNAPPSETFESTVDASGNVANANNDEHCGRKNFPEYVDMENQQYVYNEIQSGSARLILHFKNLGQEELDAFLARMPQGSVLDVGYQWPDWGSMSLVVNESGLEKLSSDCKIRLIEADRRESYQTVVQF